MDSHALFLSLRKWLGKGAGLLVSDDSSCFSASNCARQSSGHVGALSPNLVAMRADVCVSSFEAGAAENNPEVV